MLKTIPLQEYILKDERVEKVLVLKGIYENLLERNLPEIKMIIYPIHSTIDL